MLRTQLQSGMTHIGQALQTPEDFADRWQRGEEDYPWWVWFALFLTAVVGTTTYGMTMGILRGPASVVHSGLFCTLGAGLAWGIALPSLYIFNSFTGSRLPASTTLLAALVTTSWGGLAMIASIPVNWFFTTAVPHPTFVLVVNLLVFTGVGIAMIDVFGRVIERLEPTRGRWPAWWLVLVGAIGIELFYSLGLFQFGAAL